MRTTVTIPDELLAAARRRAQSRGQTLGDIVASGLRRELAVEPLGADRPVVPVFRGGSGPQPGVDLTSNAALQEALEHGVPLDARR